ncbi:MAG: Ribose 5-phosphate isomerase [Candidatus Magasanikbacteria bacterium GW2011_GWA2_42_32]|uniref:Ribose-5-phosphate isomerase B n=1 Tax=Candidatus Magasanikbacteria bacterium GW2011_GWA2_42_32 TaxID=1619039 RepID=A0A0G1CAB7_9BACT|nr:MAG: Ribose 5-phosphate isomerase [Candidatus Magasanikbacteria bacterium GW2011_GWA2_42_32]
MKTFIGSDHAGYNLKEKIKKYLIKSGIDFQDLGAKGLNPKDDYPDFAIAAAKKVAGNPGSLGIIICGTGLGSCIAANKIRGIRAAPAWNPDTAAQAREHLDANVLCLGARVLTLVEVKEILARWLETKFSGEERHLRRIKKITGLEKWPR